LADKVAGWFVPAVLAIAVFTFGVWFLWGPEPRLAYAIVNAVAVLIIACPCALGLATPMSVMVGVGRGAQSGVLIRNAEAIEMMEKIDTVVVDKTGHTHRRQTAPTQVSRSTVCARMNCCLSPRPSSRTASTPGCRDCARGQSARREGPARR
jgi:high-affinity K+ transport system ATPase subunit B